MENTLIKNLYNIFISKKEIYMLRCVSDVERFYEYIPVEYTLNIKIDIQYV